MKNELWIVLRRLWQPPGPWTWLPLSVQCFVCPLPQRAVKAAQNNITLRPVTCELTEELRRWFWKHFALHTWESVGVSEDRTVNQPDAGDVNGLSSPDRLRMIYHCFVFWCADGDRTWNGNEVLKISFRTNFTESTMCDIIQLYIVMNSSYWLTEIVSLHIFPTKPTGRRRHF